MSNLIAALAVIISLAALAYARLQAVYSRQQLKLAERIRREASEPYVVADIQPRAGGSGLLVFTVENIGPTVARDVELSVTPPLKGANAQTGMRRSPRLSGARSRIFRLIGAWSGSSLSGRGLWRTPTSHVCTPSQLSPMAPQDLSSH